MKTLYSFTICALLLISSAWAQESPDLLERIQKLPGVNAEEITDKNDSEQKIRKFRILIEQPEDHFTPGSKKFNQLLILHHRGYDTPMSLYAGGYWIRGTTLSRLARNFGTNQIQVEHRFFANSIPQQNPDWSKLTIRQSAEDFHHIIQTFKTLYPGKWINTGASKGGMTAIFTRRFYPVDLDGTVADVAPFSFGTEDPRYISFMENVGGEEYADCRQKLKQFQQIVLQRRSEILPLFSGKKSEWLGSKDLVLDHSASELPFAFWQYGNPQDPNLGCEKIPGPGADTSSVYRFLDAVNGPESYSEYINYRPYMYQTMNELGAPGYDESHLKPWMIFPYSPIPYIPSPANPPQYSEESIRDIMHWVANEAQNIQLVYGELDPWTAGAVQNLNSRPGSDNHFYTVSRGNHSANYTLLPAGQKEKATLTIARWLGLSTGGTQRPVSSKKQRSFSQKWVSPAASQETIDLRLKK